MLRTSPAASADQGNNNDVKRPSNLSAGDRLLSGAGAGAKRIANAWLPQRSRANRHSFKKRGSTAVLPKIRHCNSSQSVPNRPLWGRRGRFETLLQQLECGIFVRTAVTCQAKYNRKRLGARPPPAPRPGVMPRHPKAAPRPRRENHHIARAQSSISSLAPANPVPATPAATGLEHEALDHLASKRIRLIKLRTTA